MKYIPETNAAKDKIIISSHRRSGAHFFLQALRENRNKAKLQNGTIRHWKPDNPYLKDYDDLSTIVNVVRDGRDVLISCYY